jgi:hypothetical protein
MARNLFFWNLIFVKKNMKSVRNCRKFEILFDLRLLLLLLLHHLPCAGVIFGCYPLVSPRSGTDTQTDGHKHSGVYRVAPVTTIS